MSDSSGFETQNESDDAVRALKAATNILSEIAAGISDHYVTPYANPLKVDITPAKAILNGVGGDKPIIMDPTKPLNTEVPPHRTQIDNLLRLAAGGVQSDDE
jgi:hypothetical protein